MVHELLANVVILRLYPSEMFKLVARRSLVQKPLLFRRQLLVPSLVDEDQEYLGTIIQILRNMVGVGIETVVQQDIGRTFKGVHHALLDSGERFRPRHCVGAGSPRLPCPLHDRAGGEAQLDPLQVAHLRHRLLGEQQPEAIRPHRDETHTARIGKNALGQLLAERTAGTQIPLLAHDVLGPGKQVGKRQYVDAG